MAEEQIARLEERIAWLEKHVAEQDKVILSQTDDLENARSGSRDSGADEFTGNPLGSQRAPPSLLE